MWGVIFKEDTEVVSVFYSVLLRVEVLGTRETPQRKNLRSFGQWPGASTKHPKGKKHGNLQEGGKRLGMEKRIKKELHSCGKGGVNKKRAQKDEAWGSSQKKIVGLLL